MPSGLLGSLGIVPGETVEAGGHTGTARAIYNSEADFGTTFFSPGVDADRNVLWDGTSAGADVPADQIASCDLTEDGRQIDCAGWQPQDARRGLREEAPDVVQKVRIIALSDPIPNDTLSFGPDFPKETRNSIIAALKAFAAAVNDGSDDDTDASAGELFEDAFDAYAWNNVADTNDSEFDFIRGLVQQLGLTVTDLG